MAEIAFWVCVGVVGYAYVGYPVIVWVLAWLRPREFRKGSVTPNITVVITAHNEEARVADRIENCLALAYPPDRLDIVVVSDGSTDRTSEIVARHAGQLPDRVRLIEVPERRGKAHALNLGASAASGEILLFADSRQRFEPDVARELASCFLDPTVGAVSGELVLLGHGDLDGGGLGLYWRYEKAIRTAESRFASSIGFTGAIAAARRSLFAPLPVDALLDDLVTPLRVIARGYRVVFEPRARAVDWVSNVPGREFRRKVRTLAGVLQTQLEMRRMVGALPASLWWQFVSHKTLRLLVPYGLIAVLVSSVFLPKPLYRAVLVAQLVTYGLGVVGLCVSGRRPFGSLLSVPSTLLMLNAAAVVAAYQYATGRRLDVWHSESSSESEARGAGRVAGDARTGLVGRVGS